MPFDAWILQQFLIQSGFRSSQIVLKYVRMLFESDLIVYFRLWKYKTTEFLSVCNSGTQIAENIVIFVCSSPCNFVNSRANLMECQQNVAMHTTQTLCEYHDSAANTYRVIAFQTYIPPAQWALWPQVKVRRVYQNMPMYRTITFYEVVNGGQ